MEAKLATAQHRSVVDENTALLEAQGDGDRTPTLAVGMQKPFSELWKVTRSTRPARPSVEVAVDVCAIPRSVRAATESAWHRALL
jgi:hypothetical protein